MKITALLHDCSLDGESGYAATCVEFPEANGQGETVDECLEDLRAAVQAVLEYRRETAAESLPSSIFPASGAPATEATEFVIQAMDSAVLRDAQAARILAVNSEVPCFVRRWSASARETKLLGWRAAR